MTETTYGVLITDNDKTKILSCIPFGKAYEADRSRDIPKGRANKNELPVEVALRELKEETGLELKPEDLIDLGEQPYYRSKQIHLFHYVTDDLPDVKKMKCTSMFDIRGKFVPEMIGFEYLPLNKESVVKKFYFALSRCILNALNIQYESDDLVTNINI